MDLPIGNIKWYLLENILDPSTWLKTHTKHGWAEHERILKLAKDKLAKSCYEGKALDQKVFIQILEDSSINLLGSMILAKDKVLLENMIIFTKNDEIRAFVEDENDEIHTFYFYGDWKTKKKKPHRSNAHELYILEMKRKSAESRNNMDAERAEMRLRREQLDSAVHFTPEEESEDSKLFHD